MGITKVIVRHEDFDVSREMEELRKGSGSAGAMVAFTGVVRNRNQGDDIFALTLEHYPGMTESAITAIADKARARWELDDIVVIHRVGRLEAIRLCFASSRPRTAAKRSRRANTSWTG